MMIILTSSSLFLSTLLLSTQFPLTMTLIILAQTIVISLKIFLLSKTPWFAFMLIMVFLSSMMIVFSYVSSLMPNKFTAMNHSQAIILLPCVFISLFYLTTPISPLKSTLTLSDNNPMTPLLFKLFSTNNLMLSILLMLYLLLALVATMKISTYSPNPLRPSKL